MKSHTIIQNTGMVVLMSLIQTYFALSAKAQGNLVVNGGFDTDSSGWLITNVEVDEGGGYSSSFGNPPGSVALYNPDFGSSSPSPTASQEISSLTPGQLYIVSGDYQRGLGKNTAVDSFGVALDGLFLFETVVPTDSNWHSFSFDYAATSTSALLSLEAQINGTDYSYAIDNIAMYAVPEPNSLCLMGVGGMMSALFFRHRRKARRE
jgi:hypothetical protein